MAATPVFLEHPSSRNHDTGPHPERAARIIAIDQELSRRDWLGYQRVLSPRVARATLAAVHPEAYITMIERAAIAGGGHLDADTIMSEGSSTAAHHAAGGAVELVDRLLGGAAPFGFSAHRPPGHHAEPAQAMGFCLFNNIAVAARHALDAHGLSRVMILDWDVHHGNGTNDIFHADPRVLFVSIHQSPLYPGTGPAADVGSGDGTGYTINLPVAPGSGDDVFRSLVDGVAVPLSREFAPELLLISAGFDAHRDDPLAQCLVTEAGFAAMAASMRDVCAELEIPFGGVLEGGYAVQALARSLASTLEAFRGEPAAVAAPEASVSVAAVPEAQAARERVAAHWPALAG
jgi:acetoin utilization deacetylase AcuC-like enzyme